MSRINGKKTHTKHSLRPTLMGTKNLYENGLNLFFLFGTKNMVRTKLMATVLFRHGFDRRSGCVLIFLQTSLSLSMRGRYNNEIAE